MTAGSNTAGGNHANPTKWWTAGVTCALAVPVWTLVLVGVTAGLGNSVIDLEWFGRGALAAVSILCGAACAGLAWRIRGTARNSGRWIGAAAAMLIVGLLVSLAGDAL